MKPLEVIDNLMNLLVIADTKTIADLMAHRGFWTTGNPYANSYKYLRELTQLDKLVKGDGYFKLPTCKSEYGEHAQLLTQALALIIKTPYEPVIYREKTIDEVGLRPDALVLLKNGDKGRCFLLEVVNNELPIYLEKKKNAWETWQGDFDYLSRLFGYKIPHYDFVISDDLHSYLGSLQ